MIRVPFPGMSMKGSYVLKALLLISVARNAGSQQEDKKGKYEK